MRFFDVVELVWASLWRRKGRTILTTMGVVIGTAAIVTMMSLGIGMQNSLTEQFESMGNAKDITVMPPIRGGSSIFTTTTSATDILDKKTIDKIIKLKNVASITPAFSLSATTEIKVGQYSTGMNIVGYDPKYGKGFDVKMAEGKFLNQEDGLFMVVGYKVPGLFVDTRNQKTNHQQKGTTLKSSSSSIPGIAAVNQRINVLHKTAQLTISRTNEMSEKEAKTLRVKIIGIVAEKGSNDDYAVYMPMQEVASLTDWAKGQQNTLKKQGYESLTVHVTATDKVDEVVSQISDLGFTAFSLKQLLSQLTQSFIVIQAVLGGIGAIALLVASIGIINTMTMSIYERTREIGIMKVVGASLVDIRNIFLLEAGTIGLMGGIVGIVLSYIIAVLINFFMSMYIISTSGGSTQTGSLLMIPIWLVIFAMVFASFIGLLAGVYPAMKAARLSALSAIRTE